MLVDLHNVIVSMQSDGSVLFGGQKSVVVTAAIVPAGSVVLGEVWTRATAPGDDCLVLALASADECKGLSAGVEIEVSACAGDFDDSGGKSVQDLFAFLQQFFTQNGQCAPGLSADINANGCVSVQDLFSFLTAWYAECP